jgi:hypothetical protein
MKLLIMQSSPASCHLLPLRSKYSQRRSLKHLQSMFFPYYDLIILDHHHHHLLLLLITKLGQ